MANKHMDRNKQQKAQDNPGKRSDNDFPGYPHYPKNEDMMDGRSDAERVNVNVESLPNFHNATTSHRLNNVESPERASGNTPTDRDREADLGIEMGNEADVTAEERKVLEDDMYYPTRDEDNLRQARLDDTDFDGEPLNEESFGAGQVESGDDLDIEAGVEGGNTSMEQEDEENQYWSLGGAENDNMVEGTP